MSFDVNALLASLRLGDLIAVGGALLFLFAKFFKEVSISVSSRVGTTIPGGFGGDLCSNAGCNGWQRSGDIWDFLQFLTFVAVVAAAVLLGLGLLPQYREYKGWIYVGGGGLLVVTTILAFFFDRLDILGKVGGVTTVNYSYGPSIGFFLLFIFGIAVAAGGLMKQGIIPGDAAVSLAGSSAALGNRGPQPFSSSYYSGQQPPQPPQGPPQGQPPQGYGAPPPQQGGGYGAPPPPPPQGSYGAPPAAPGPQGYNQPTGGGGYGPPPSGYGNPPQPPPR